MRLRQAAFALLTLLVFSLPWEKSVELSGLGTISRALGILALAAGVIHVVTQRRVRSFNLLLALAGLFVLWSGVTWFWSYDRLATVAKTRTLLQLFLMSWLVWELCRSRQQQRTLLLAYVGGSTVAALATIARYAASLQTYYRRYAAPGFDPNDLGLTLAIGVAVALWLALRSPPSTAWLMRAAVLLCLAAILLTASRTALVCTALGFLIVPFCWREARPVARVLNVALLLMLMAGALALAPKESRQRIATIGKEVTRGTLHKRTTIWKAGLQAWKARKLTGVGSGAYPDAVRPMIGVPGVPGHEYVAHNTFLSVLVETGLVGFVLYGALLFIVAICILVLQRTERALWGTVLIVWAVGVATLTWEQRKPTWLIFALVSTEWARAFRQETAPEVP